MRCGTSASSTPATLLDDYRFRSIDARDRRSTAWSARRSRTRCRRRCTTPRSRRPASTRSTCRCRRPTPTTSSTFARAIGLKGASVTIPFKVVAVRARRRGRCRWRGGSARSTPSACADGRWLGGNTDVAGFLQPLRRARRRAARAARASILGAGGSARAVAIGARVARAPTVTRARARPRRAPSSGATLVGGASGAWPPAAGQLGPARQLHAGRHASARRRDRRCRRRR